MGKYPKRMPEYMLFKLIADVWRTTLGGYHAHITTLPFINSEKSEKKTAKTPQFFDPSSSTEWRIVNKSGLDKYSIPEKENYIEMDW